MIKENELISIIVPIYNVEKYLPKCIESIMTQTYENIEIILVDDGSTDNSGLICDEYKEKDSRIVVIHKKNGGLSDARNTGTETAKGEYVGFIDSDDYIDKTMYEKLYNAIKQNDADMSICSWVRVDEDGDEIIVENESSPLKDEVINGEIALSKVLVNNGVFYVTAWNKLYKKDLVKKIKFPVGKIHEDEFTVHRFMHKCNKIVCISDILYFYLKRSDSITGIKSSDKKKELRSLINSSEAMLDRCEYCIEYYSENKDIIEKVMSLFIFSISHLIIKGYGYSKDLIAAYRKVYLKSQKINISKKKRIIFGMFNYIPVGMSYLMFLRRIIKYRR